MEGKVAEASRLWVMKGKVAEASRLWVMEGRVAEASRLWVIKEQRQDASPTRFVSPDVFTEFIKTCCGSHHVIPRFLLPHGGCGSQLSSD